MTDQSNIAAGTVIRGRIEADGDLDVHGQVEGAISVGGQLTIGQDGLIKSDLSGQRVAIAGAVVGDVSATESIVLEAGSRTQGDLSAPSLGIRPGALIRGRIETGGTGGARPRATRQAAPAARPAVPEASAPAEQPAAAPAAERPARSAPQTAKAAKRSAPSRKKAPAPVMPRASARAKKKTPAAKAKAAAPKPVVPALKKRTKKAKRRTAR